MLLASAASFLAISSLILLFLIVFAIIGLHVYGGTQQSNEYPNFSTFLLSVTTMFQVCLCSHHMQQGLPNVDCTYIVGSFSNALFAYVLKLALAYGCYMLIGMRSLVIMPIYSGHAMHKLQ